MTVELGKIAEIVRGEVIGDASTIVSGVSSIQEAGPGDLVFADSKKHMEKAFTSPAAAVLTNQRPESLAKPSVLVSNPREAFAAVLGLFAAKLDNEPGVSNSAHVAKSARLADSVSIGFNAYIGNEAVIGERSVIMPLAYIGDGVTVGEDCVIFPHVTIYPGCLLENRVRIHSGAVIGADGFGYNFAEGAHRKIPHIGSVVIHDDVEVGANTTIDRARTGCTEIGRGTKIDNLVHIAHNVKVGENCIVIAHVGISGSVNVGNGVVLAGQAGIKDNVTIGDGAVIGAKTGVISDIPPKSKVAGFPARPYGEQMRIWAGETRLPEALKQIADLQARIEELEKRLGEGQD